MEGYARLCISGCAGNARYSAWAWNAVRSLHLPAWSERRRAALRNQGRRMP